MQARIRHSERKALQTYQKTASPTPLGGRCCSPAHDLRAQNIGWSIRQDVPNSTTPATRPRCDKNLRKTAIKNKNTEPRKARRRPYPTKIRDNHLISRWAGAPTPNLPRIRGADVAADGGCCVWLKVWISSRIGLSRRAAGFQSVWPDMVAPETSN